MARRKTETSDSNLTLDDLTKIVKKRMAPEAPVVPSEGPTVTVAERRGRKVKKVNELTESQVASKIAEIDDVNKVDGVPADVGGDAKNEESNNERNADAPIETSGDEDTMKKRKDKKAEKSSKSSAPRRKSKGSGSTDQIATKYRSLGNEDAVAKKLAGMSSISEMVAYAKSFPLINMPSLDAKAKAAKAGTMHTGLLRMQIGNLIRGAINRASKQRTKIAAKKDAKGSAPRRTRRGK